ncbi:MAG: DUF3991 and toprim domain-containing protein [Clostridium sp.]|jgi:hypothetical protein|nr:DUF3991 and toprim domain-containing protein [Clostridium sp.]
MPYIDPEVVLQARQMDLLTYLESYEPGELARAGGNVYCTRTHDSLKISNGKWCWHSRGIGGRSALDYLVKVRGMGFLEAVEQIMGRAALQPPAAISRPKEPPRPFALPQEDGGISEVERYLHGRRGISRDVIRSCAGLRMLYQTRNRGYANAVFVGYDKDRTPRYAGLRGTVGSFKGDAPGSDKRYSFALPGGGRSLHLFESAIDLLSFATLEGARVPDLSGGDLLSLSGVYRPGRTAGGSALPPALTRYLADHPEIRGIHLHLDSDPAGRLATQAILEALPAGYTATDEPPPSGKDYNDSLCDRLRLPRTPQARQDPAR